MANEVHHENIRNQFAQRILTYESAARWMLNEDLIEAHREVVGRPEGDANTCLDICCGTGIVGRSLLDLGWKVRGLDLTPEMAWVASQYFPVKIGSAEKIPYADNSYDVAIIRQAFMLLDGPKTLREIHRVLKPGGRFILIQSVSFSEDDDLTYQQVQNARHINMTQYYRNQDLEKILQTAGFAIAGSETLRVRESVDHWLNSAPELKPELRSQIRNMIEDAPEPYRRIRSVENNGGELFEDWNWSLITGQKANC
jgi:ubiquinone/menaquinone biosynthesis C-methylase UbiE